MGLNKKKFQEQYSLRNDDSLRFLFAKITGQSNFLILQKKILEDNHKKIADTAKKLMEILKSGHNYYDGFFYTFFSL